MATGVTSSITSDVSFTSHFQLTKDDDTLIIQGATVTMLEPQGDIFTDAGNDTVLIEDALIITEEPNLAFMLGSGDDTMTVKNTTFSAPVMAGSGNDTIVIEGTLQTQVLLNSKLSFGTGNDLLELVSVLQNVGGIDFGSSGTKTLRFNGGALFGEGTISSLTNLDVTLSGGTTATGLVLSGEQTAITLNGNFFGTTNDKDISVSGGTTTLTTDSNARTNVRLKLNQVRLLCAGAAILEFSDHSGYAVTADESVVDLANIVVKGGLGLTGSSTVWTVIDCDFSNSTKAIVLTGGSLQFQNLGMTNFRSGALELNGTTLTGSKMSLISNYGSGGMRVVSAAVEITDLRANSNYAYYSDGGAIYHNGGDMTLTSATFSGNSAYFGGAIYHNGGNMTLTSATFIGNMASTYKTGYAYAYGGAIYHNIGNMTLTSAVFSGNIASAYSAYGGAICHTSGDMTLTGATFIGNMASTYKTGYAYAYGGAIYHNIGNMTLTSAVFSGNIAFAYVSGNQKTYAYGGAICHSGGNMTLSGAVFSGNIASSYITSNYNVSASAYAYGGAIHHGGGDMILTSASFSGNIAYAYAYASAYPSASAYAYAKGGAIYQSGGIMTLTSASFSGNNASASAYARTATYASAYGGAIYLESAIANMEDTVFSGNIASTSNSFYASAYGGAIFLTNTTLNYVVTSGTKISNFGNIAQHGGWLYAADQSTVNITVNGGGKLTIGDDTGNDSIELDATGRFTKNGTGYMLVNGAITGTTGLWTVTAGTLELARVARTLNLDNWTIGTDATLILSVQNDTINMSMNKKIGTIDLGGGADTINTGGFDLTDGTILMSDLTLNGGGRISVKLRNRSTTDGSTLRLNNVFMDSEFTGNDYTDTILITQESILNGAIDLKNGENVVSATAKTTFNNTLKMGSGNDNLKFTGVTFRDSVELGGGDNMLTATGSAVFSGTLNATTGTDTLNFADVSFLESADLGDGDNSLTATGSAGFAKGLNAGAGTDVLNLSAVTFEDAVNLGDGDNALTAAGTAKLKDITTGIGNDTLSFAAVTFEEAVDLGDGDNSLTATGSAGFAGTLTTGSGNDTLTFQDATFAKAVSTGDGNDTLAFASATFEETLDLGDGNNSLTVTGPLSMKTISGGSGNDTITLRGDSAISGEIDLGGGVNSVYVRQSLTTDKVRITEGGQTTVYVYLNSVLTGNALSVYSDAEAARDTITLNWSSQTDLDKVRILVSDDSSFDTFEFAVELYNQSKSFTLDLQHGYFIQFQAQDEDGWKQRLLDDTVAPNQVTGVAFDGKALTWDETHDDLSGNGVKQYHVEISDDASFATVLTSTTVTGTQYALASEPEKMLYFRVSAEDHTGNTGAWSQTASGEFDLTPPSRPSGGATAVEGYSATMTWSAASDSGTGVVRYEYRVAADSGYEEILAEGTTETCSFSVENYRIGTYYWQVRAEDSVGNLSEWSLSKSFTTVDTVVPGTPTNLDFDVENGETLTVIWDAVVDDDLLGSGLKGYEIQIASDSAFANIVKTVSVSATEATIENLANATYYMRVCAVDNAGNKSGWTETKNFEIDKDTTPPTVTNIQANITTPTNQTVTVTATFSDNVAVASSLYRIGADGVWTDYPIDGVTVTDNTTVYFKAVDTNGNESAEASFAVGNIDKTKPAKPTASVDVSTPTNDSVSVVAAFSEDSVVKEYSMDQLSWLAYIGPVVFHEIGTVYFRGIDEAGNVSDITAYTVSNLDTLPPEKPTASADVTTPTNQAVIVTATFSADSYKKEYSLDGEVWETYSAGVTVTENGTVYFRGIDEAGNISEVTEFQVDNIDTVAPEKPAASADVTSATRGNVLVSAVFSDDSNVKEYSLNGENWQAYTQPVLFTENGTVSFRGTDEAGNPSDTTVFTVNNIISVPLDAPVVSADVTVPTHGTVTVSATFSEIAAVKQYSVDGQTWLDYNQPLTFTENGFAVFLCVDASGECAYTAYAVTNIDTIAPEQPGAYATATAPTNRDVTVKAMFSNDTSQKEYSWDGETWLTYTDGLVFEENGIVFFRGTDAAGNVSAVTTYEVTNIDKIAPNAPVASADVTTPTNRSVMVSAQFSEDSALREYSLDGENWSDYTVSLEFNENGMSYFRGTDEAGNISSVVNYAVIIIDREPPAAPVASASITTITNKDVFVSAAFSEDSSVKEYSLDGQTWQDYTEAIKFTENGVVSFRALDLAGNFSDVTVFTVDNIDKIAPEAPVASADVTEPTNGDVLVSATFSDDSAIKEYSRDNQSWDLYTEAVKLSENGTVYFRSTDAAGNQSEVSSYEARNIDKIVPVITLSGDNQTPLKASTLTATVDDGSPISFSTDNVNWIEYTGALTVTANATYYFTATDAAGNVGTNSYTFTNIDSVAPVITLSGDNQMPLQSSSLTASTDDGSPIYYRIGGTGDWTEYSAPITVTANATYYFSATDAAGNEGTAKYVFANIDTVAPVAPVASADVTTPTNGDVLVSATFSDDTVKMEFCLDGTNWKTYTGPIRFAENGSVSFRGADAAGNVSALTTYDVTNIDKVALEKPIATANILVPTNTDVLVSAIFPAEAASREYSRDNQTWQAYTEAIVFTENGIVYFRNTDDVGNISEVTAYEVTNIDKVKPDAPTATANVTSITNDDVFVSATFSDDSVVKEYSLNGQNWLAYTEDVKLTANATVSFRGTDAAGNISEVTSYEVSNIDKEAPVAPVASADITAPTNGDVTVTAKFTEDSVKKEYSLDGGETWEDYPEGGVIINNNRTVSFRSIDAAGNISDVTDYEVMNIDKVAPNAPVASANITTVTQGNVLVSATFSNDSVVKEYSLDDVTWTAYTQSIVFKENGTVYFRSTDAAGNLSEVTIFTVDNIIQAIGKPVASADITTPTNKTVTVSAVFDPQSVKNEYSINGLVWLTYIDGVSMLENGIVYFRGTSAAGSESEIAAYTVSNIDKVAPEKPFIFASTTSLTNQDITVTAVFSEDSTVKEYSTDGQTWLPYIEPITVSDNGMLLFRAKDEAGNSSGLVNFEVNNIDKTAPVKPVATTDVTELTNKDVTVTATFSDDSAKQEYSLDGETWQDYPEGGVIIIINGTVGFRGTDAAGNISEVTTYEVSNIDKVAPEAPASLEAIVEDQTVTLSWAASTDDLAGVKEYIVAYSHDGQEFTANTTATSFVIENADFATWQWNVQAVDAVGNVSEAAVGKAFAVVESVEPEPEKKFVAKSDIDGNGISDVLFVWTGEHGEGNYQHGYWMNGTDLWQSADARHPSDWDNLGCYDMTGDGKADSVLFGNVNEDGIRGAYIGYYADGDDLDDNWVTIGYLDSIEVDWKNKVGNLTGNEKGANSIVWYTAEMHALGAWKDGKEDWVSIAETFGGDAWTLVGCGDFDGDGKDSIMMSYNGGQLFYTADIDGTTAEMGDANWSGWEVRAIGDFKGDGKDDLVLFHKETGSMVMIADGKTDVGNYTDIGQLSASDWFIVGCGDYDNDQKDDLLVRQYSTGWLGYYTGGIQSNDNWNLLGRGVGMEWTVIA